jgi:3-oxoadipate enol-lactonase
MTTPTNDTRPVETGYVDVPGGKLYYEVTGEGHPLVFVHADVADLHMWDEQVAAFADRYRVARYDKRGFGKTTSEPGPFSSRDDLLAVLDHLGIEKTYLVGLSNGAVLVLDFTIEHPERVDALVTVAGGVGGYDGPEPTEAEQAAFAKYGELQEKNDQDGLLDLGVHVWCDGPGQPEGRSAQSVRDRIRAMMSANYSNHPEQDQLQPQPLEPQAYGRLQDIHIPTMSVQGSFDESGTNASMDLVAERVPGARREVFETAHMVNMEQPERFNALLAEFLADAEKANGQ